jgi:hypothetical protein
MFHFNAPVMLPLSTAHDNTLVRVNKISFGSKAGIRGRCPNGCNGPVSDLTISWRAEPPSVRWSHVGALPSQQSWAR